MCDSTVLLTPQLCFRAIGTKNHTVRIRLKCKGDLKTGYQKIELGLLIKFLLPHPQMGLAGNCRLGKGEAMKQRLHCHF